MKQKIQATMNFSLKKLRGTLSQYQIKLLNLFWQHYLDNRKWPAPTDVHQNFSKKEVHSALRCMGGQPSFAGHIVEQSHSETGPIYSLSLIGILLTKDGKKYESWLIRLFDFFHIEYYQRKKPPGTEYDEQQIGDALKLNGSELEILGDMTRFGTSLSAQSYSHTVGKNWKIRLPHDMDDFPPNEPVNAHFEEILFRYSNNQKWVFHGDGMNAAGVTPNDAAETFDEAMNSIKDEMTIETNKVLTNQKNKRSKPELIFMSHSSHDKDLLEALTDLLRAAFSWPTKKIFCTSVAGHTLTSGDNTEEKLLDLLKNVPLLIGVLTPASLRSSYVLFELGARWGLRMPLIPLVARGVKMEDLKEPLKARHALDVSEEANALKLIEDVAEHLKQKPEAPSAYMAKVRHLVSMAQELEKTAGKN